jgi:hypothetical protein
MNNRFIYLLLFGCFSFNLPGQSIKVKDKESFISFFDEQDSLDAIEGIWVLNVVNTLFDKDGNILGQSLEEAKSAWAIVRTSKSRFRVYDIGNPGKNPSKFKAHFKKDLESNQYTYTCKFKNPNWKATAAVLMNDAWALEYGYFVANSELKAIDKFQYEAGFKLHWRFIWTKKYPDVLERKLTGQ